MTPLGAVLIGRKQLSALETNKKLSEVLLAVCRDLERESDPLNPNNRLWTSNQMIYIGHRVNTNIPQEILEHRKRDTAYYYTKP